jgi:hypothetical protein
MDSVVGDEMSVEKIFGVAKVNECVVLNACPGDADPDKKPNQQSQGNPTICSIDPCIHLCHTSPGFV